MLQNENNYNTGRAKIDLKRSSVCHYHMKWQYYLRLYARWKYTSRSFRKIMKHRDKIPPRCKNTKYFHRTLFKTVFETERERERRRERICEYFHLPSDQSKPGLALVSWKVFFWRNIYSYVVVISSIGLQISSFRRAICPNLHIGWKSEFQKLAMPCFRIGHCRWWQNFSLIFQLVDDLIV